MLKSALIISSVLLCIAASTCTLAQVRVMPRVDARDPSMRAVVQVWIDSLESWRASSASIPVSDWGADVIPGGMSGIVKNWFAQDEEVRQTFPPTILSAEPHGDAWIVRTMFSHINTATGDIYPLGILRVRIERRNGKDEIVDPLSTSTIHWIRTRIGSIVYVHEPEHVINDALARESNTFLALTARELDQPMPDSVVYYVAPNRDALCGILGVEFYAAPPSAISYPATGIIISGTNTEWNAHEIVHVVLARFETATPVIREGIATYLGGSLGKPFDVLLEEYLANHAPEKIPSLRQLFERATQEEQYVLGAALCKAVYDRQGRDGLVTLLAASTPLRAMDHIARILGISKDARDTSLHPVLSDVNAAQKNSVRSGLR